jgi:glutathione S-transferase
MLEELGLPYQLEFVDLLHGAQKQEALLALNPMGKVPVLVDGEAVVTETAAIGLYLADRYALGQLAPALDDPQRGTYLRMAFYAPSVVEVACLARSANWSFKPGQAGFGTYEEVLSTLDRALQPGPYLLGERFTMADVILGATVRWMLSFKMLDPLPTLTAYAERLGERPALQRANARNAAIVAERGLSRPG